MQILNVKQIRQDGLVKTWKLNSESSLKTFGQSRKAQLQSIDNTISPYELVLECRDQVWYLTQFGLEKEHPCQIIYDGYELELASSKLKFNLTPKNPFILKNLADRYKLHNQTSQFVVVTYRHQIIYSEYTHSKSAFSFEWNGLKKDFNFNESHQFTWDELTITSYPDESRSHENILRSTDKINLHSPQTKIYGGLFGFTLLAIVTALLLKKPEQPILTKSKSFTQSTIIKTQFKKSKLQKTQTTIAANTQPKNESAAAPSQKLKGALGARISQLMGKVSAAEARSKNIILTQTGAAAGTVPTGRALAAIGNVNSPGRDWKNDSQVGGNTRIGTAGVGGGNGNSNFNTNLAQGSTGQGGVGLIEEESEIIGGLDREVIAQYIKTQLGQILYCYERQLSASPDLYGKIAVKFTIAGTGQVETQTINDTTLKNRQVENCILGKVAKWKFPEPRGGTKVVVTYPFLFKSTN